MRSATSSSQLKPLLSLNLSATSSPARHATAGNISPTATSKADFVLVYMTIYGYGETAGLPLEYYCERCGAIVRVTPSSSGGVNYANALNHLERTHNLPYATWVSDMADAQNNALRRGIGAITAYLPNFGQDFSQAPGVQASTDPPDTMFSMKHRLHRLPKPPPDLHRIQTNILISNVSGQRRSQNPEKSLPSSPTLANARSSGDFEYPGDKAPPKILGLFGRAVVDDDSMEGSAQLPRTNSAAWNCGQPAIVQSTADEDFVEETKQDQEKSVVQTRAMYFSMDTRGSSMRISSAKSSQSSRPGSRPPSRQQTRAVTPAVTPTMSLSNTQRGGASSSKKPPLPPTTITSATHRHEPNNSNLATDASRPGTTVPRTRRKLPFSMEHTFVRQCCQSPDPLECRISDSALLTMGDYEAQFFGAPPRADVIDDPASAEVFRNESKRTVGVDLRRFDVRRKQAQVQEQEQMRQAAEESAMSRSGQGSLFPELQLLSQGGASLKPSSSQHSGPGQASMFAPPKITLMMFRFANVANLPVTAALQKVGYPELNEQFSSAVDSRGMVTRNAFLNVMSRYLNAHEKGDALKILDCFDRNAHGDVLLDMLLIGMQILLHCATPSDTLRYCFQLLDASSKMPRYLTRYEAQTLLTYSDESAAAEVKRELIQQADGNPSAADQYSVEELVSMCTDKEYRTLRAAIETIVSDSTRYDYQGRMPLQSFLDALESEISTSDTGGTKGRRRRTVVPDKGNNKDLESSSKSVSGNPVTSPGKGSGQNKQFAFGSAWQGSAALLHRMSSKRMILSSGQ